MNAELQIIADRITQATTPEDIFGELQGDPEEKLAHLKFAYRRLARITHPDHYLAAEDQHLAHTAFSRLTDWFGRAEARIKAGVYELYTGRQNFIISSRKHSYQFNGSYTSGMVYNHYPCSYVEDGRIMRTSMKVVRDPQDNNLAQNEARVLRLLSTGKASSKFGPYLPRLVESFTYQQEGTDYQANVFARKEGWFSMEEVRQAYPGGIDPKDMAWMFRRLLVALGFLHLNGVIHGAVLPGNIFILPKEHGIMLEEYSFAVSASESAEGNITVIDPAYEDWYPAEVHRKERPLPGTDIGMAAHCMMDVMGAGPQGSTWPESVPDFLRSFFKGCTLPAKNARPQDAWALKEEFDRLLHRHWGERKFHPFTMKAF